MASNNIKVICRFRPTNALEQREGSEIVVSFDDSLATVQLRSMQASSGPERDGFTFDRVFPMGTQQQEVFDYDVLDGYNGTVFAYGQTGSGKTFTMMGADIDSPELKGIIPRITEQIFQSIVESDAHLEYFVKVSYMEIYLERIRDLLHPQNDNLQVHEEKNKGVYVKNLSDYYVSSAQEVYEIMRQGGAARVVTSTNMNAESSRSHSIFLITISQRNTETGAQKTGNLYLVDLAGSEKVGKTGASGQTLEEAKKINKSLSALGMVINALTDGKAKHIPYRDSKLTRILQESLGGNSRTTLIINCSPASYNETETLSTLRFGIRAKSIKNTARVNAELSPQELKNLLQKAQVTNASHQKAIAALEAELAVWRAGGTVDPSEYAAGDKAGATSPPPKKTPTATTPSTARSMTPVNPVLEGLKDLDSRPQTPTVVGLDKDERDEFLKRENELSDQLAERESALIAADKLVKELKEELAFLKEQEASLSKENKAISAQVNELRLQAEKLGYDNKEGLITIDILKEQNADQRNELEEYKKTIAELRTSQKDSSSEDKERRKQEKMALMMAQFDAQGTFSEKDEQLRQILSKLDTIDNDAAVSTLTAEDVTHIRRHLAEGQSLVRDSVDRLRQKQEESDMVSRRKDELEGRLASLEAEYEELLEKTIHEEETSNVDVAESMAELKNKLESQYAAKREAHLSEVTDLKQQLEMKSNEMRSLNASIDSLKGVNEELKRAFAVTSAGIEGGKNLAESAQDLERTRKAINVQLAEFDGVKKSLMRDLQNRCEKVVELEIQLDEIKEQYNNVIRNSNSKAQQKKMAFLERNLEQLTLVQKQLVDQNSALKKEAGIAERKLLARNERIQNLEALLQDADRRLAMQNQKFEAQLQAVKDRLDQARAQKAATSSLSFAGRIAKPLRGGGGAAPSAPAGPTPIAGGGGSANPLARLQNEEGCRASWFFQSR
ncbi:kinesin heavy chain [Amylostereum chailletii]|nr:kinesin heavy chain [Amylostereum chailletii]